MKTQLWVLMLIIGLLGTINAFADDNIATDNIDKDTAMKAFQEGVDYFTNEEYDKASEAFRKANNLHSNWKLFYNIGQSEASAKRYGLALEAFEAYLAHAGDDIEIDRRDEILAEVQRLKLMVGAIEIEAPAGSEVYIDANIRGTVPLTGSLLLSSGIEHNVKIVDGETVLLSRDIKLSSGQSITLRIEHDSNSTKKSNPEISDNSDNLVEHKTSESQATAESTTEEPATDVPTTNVHGKPTGQNKPSRAPGIALIATGAALIIGGAVTGSIAMVRGKSLESDYPNGVPSSKHDKMNSVDKLAVTTDILLGIGIVTAAVGTIILLRKKKKESALSAIPIVGPRVTGLSVTGRF